MNQSAVFSPCIWVVAMSRAITSSPWRAKMLLAQQVFEPTSTSRWPGSKLALPSRWVIARCCDCQ